MESFTTERVAEWWAYLSSLFAVLHLLCTPKFAGRITSFSVVLTLQVNNAVTMLWISRKIKTVVMCGLSTCVFSYLTDTQDWEKFASYFWTRSYELLLLLRCQVSNSASLQWLETVGILLFSDLQNQKDHCMLWITQFPFGSKLHP